jgi:uncharacterized protein (DUF1697 family)
MNLGNRRLPMSRLRALVADLGFREVETFIASGNVLFSSQAADVGRLEARIAKHLESSLGYPVDTFIRTAERVAAIARSRPFPEAGQEGITVHVGFWHRKIPADLARKLAAVRTDEDEFRVEEREYYWLCRVRTSDSKVWTLPEINALKFPSATMRNMTSIRKLAAKHPV